MKQIQNIALAVIGFAVVILYYLHFSTRTKPVQITKDANLVASANSNNSIAYFEMDSVETHYTYIKEVREKLKTREAAITNELSNMKRGYMGRVQQLQQKAATMSQQEGEAAQAEINQMEESLRQKEAKLGQEMQEQQFKLLQDINNKIQTFLVAFNKDKKYTYIFSHQAGDFIYFKDSLLNITPAIVSGLNEMHQQKGGEKK